MKTILLDGLWGAPWRLQGFRRHLLGAGLGPVEIFSYDSSGRQSLETLADELAQFIGTDPVRVAAHSMGGLVTRLAKLRYPHISLVATAFLCVPHKGSLLARYLPFKALGLLTGVCQLRPESEIVHELQGQDWQIPTLTVWCPGDLMVIPGASARWSKATQEICCRVPLHNWPVVSPSFHRAVARFFLHHSPSSL